MDLWIRSQDNKDIIPCLFKANNIWICETENRITIENHDGEIAEYKTKERALEVLDEIQNILIDYSKISRVVYQMPEE